MDDWQAHAVKNLRDRHEARIAENAERIREHIGYVLKRIESGRSDAVGIYAEDIESSIRRILASVAALETLKEATAILETSDNPATER
jgi:hypothetical protein